MFKHNLIVDFSATKRMPEIDFEIKSLVREAIKATLEYEGFPNPAEVSVTFCDNAHIKQLNGQYRSVDKHTDVLSFPMYDFYLEEDLAFAEDEEVSLGDIVISVERAAEQAQEIGNTFAREVAFLTVHSMLHLLGYDHERSEDDEQIQCDAQKEIMQTVDAYIGKEN